MSTASTVNNYFGWIPDLPDRRDKKYSTPMPILEQLPPFVDLRPFCPPVYNQSSLGSCTSNAIAGAIEFDLLKQKLDDFTPSRLFIYYNEREMEGTVSEDAGAMIRDGVKSVNAQGACKETTWGYDITRFRERPDSKSYEEALSHVAVDYRRLPRDINQMKGCLAEGYPFTLGFAVYDSFMNMKVMQTGVMDMPSMNEQVRGGHAVLAVGFFDDTQRFIIRNSWGDRWGQCLTGDTSVPLLNGTEKTLEQLVKQGNPVWIYSYDTSEEKIVPAMAIPKFTGYRNDMVRVVLDNDKAITCTGDHLFMLRNGDYRAAKDLKQGQSLMPLYTRTHKEYEEVYNVNSRNGKYVPIHKVVGHDEQTVQTLLEHSINCKNNLRCDIIIHHIDRNKHNNEPINLLKTYRCQHHIDHHSEKVEKSRQIMKERWTNNYEAMKENSIKSIQQYNEGLKRGEYDLTEKQIQTRKDNCRTVGKGNKKNHKVINIQKLDEKLTIPVYDLMVPRENCHNFALSAGIFVHNSGYFTMPYQYLADENLSDDFWAIRLVR